MINPVISIPLSEQIVYDVRMDKRRTKQEIKTMKLIDGFTLAQAKELAAILTEEEGEVHIIAHSSYGGFVVVSKTEYDEDGYEGCINIV